HGAFLYTDKGFQIAFLIGAVASGIGALLAAMLPRRIEQVQVPAAQIADEAVVVAH
ncbi:MAG: MFS transporter, partial [Comamonadaceae bacterium]